jgi:hypothetical protein
VARCGGSCAAGRRFSPTSAEISPLPKLGPFVEHLKNIARSAARVRKSPFGGPRERDAHRCATNRIADDASQPGIENG